VGAVVVRRVLLLEVKAAQVSSSFPMLAHNNLVAVSSLQVVVTPFTHLQLLALLFQLHLCLQTTLWLQVVVAAVQVTLVVVAQGAF
jgi:hypothetical protein